MSTKVPKKKLKSLEYRSKKFSKKSKTLEDHEKEVEDRARAQEQKLNKKAQDEEAPKVSEAKTNEKDKKEKKRSLEEESESTKEKPKKQKSDKKEKRVILFVGNLPKDSDVETLQEHFKRAGQMPRVRIPTEKGTGRQRGYAFVEFINPHHEVASKALKFHHTMYKDRKINIELTAGGGGKTESRMNKIKEKNKKWTEERRERVANEEKKAREVRGSKDAIVQEGVQTGIHPDRLHMLK
ncbi:RNA-binding protein, involved in ribosome biogenesis [Schizosaccharomyces osmophilus]|uniref:RNA-binding protein, involved in ribosome biogenesis n=1 Tax=Schizosaccharomyces osmophilus TaxID=2545709 RepID=A0AAE9WET1_9SCHI|nr:RNA-binding protein, involved in ribosome biogenesis [Schizosaccharomyces osmophilus]WBW73887.1 RNA-binding protein, involved in ribosome biogenesis [Schizosaccharomyces osmophilus]